MRIASELERYRPFGEQEKRDLPLMRDWLENARTPLLRDNAIAHFTASAWVINPSRDRVLLIYHNIYDSWAWTGGHADGEDDLESVARREAEEESGIVRLKPLLDGPLSVEILAVNGHEKKGSYVSTHSHMNVTYLFEADDSLPLRAKPDENSGVGWFSVSEIPAVCREEWMVKRVYDKLCRKVAMLLKYENAVPRDK